MSPPIPYQPIILLGAARSGTKLLRDLIAQHPDVEAIPYDVNFIWRLADPYLNHDELDPATLSSESRDKIVTQLSYYWRDSAFLIEKTVSNSLRVPFVNAVFPDALFIHLIRDGVDVVESSFRQWNSPPNWPYLLRKASSFPLSVAYDYAFSYARRALRHTIRRVRDNHDIWGPKYKGIEADLDQRSLLEVVALQWAHCVLRSRNDLKNIPSERQLPIRYEEFVRNPTDYLDQISAFVGIAPIIWDRIDSVTWELIGRGHRSLTEEQYRQIRPIVDQVESHLKLVG